jgi:hypothetical protein
MTRRCLLSPWASGSTWWKPVIVSMQAAPSGFMPWFARISRQRRLSTRSWSSCSAMVCPRCSRVLRDPRWVGSASGRDFPSVLVRFLLCLGIGPNICPPHRPDKNCYVERLHRTYKYECLLVHRPATAEQVTRPSPTGSCSTTTRSDPIKDAPVTLCRHGSPFRAWRFYLPCLRRWIRTAG